MELAKLLLAAAILQKYYNKDEQPHVRVWMNGIFLDNPMMPVTAVDVGQLQALGFELVQTCNYTGHTAWTAEA